MTPAWTWTQRVGLVLVMSVGIAGCSNAESTEKAPIKGAPVGSQPGAMSIKRVINRPNVYNELTQLVVFYQLYRNDNNNRSPASLEDLKPSIERDMPKLYEGIRDGYYVVFWGIKDLSSNVVVAHEKEPDSNGLRATAMGDGSVKRINEQDFQEALKGK